MKQETEIKDKKILLVSLNRDIVQASEKLTAVLVEIENSENRLKLSLAQEKSVLESIKQEHINLEQRENDIKNYAKDAQLAVSRSQSELSALKRQKTEAMKELRRLNDWILTAEEREQELKTVLAELESKSYLKTEFVADLEQIKAERVEEKEINRLLQQEFDTLTLEITLARESLDAFLAEKEQKEQELAQKQQKAEENLKELEQRDKKIREELALYEERVREKYSEAFPARELKVVKL